VIFQVVVGPIAKEDLSRNANWWADNHSVDQAVKWIDAVELQLHDLVPNPERFGYAPENGLFSYPLHQMLVGMGKRRSYRAVYTIKTTEVHVLTIRRAAQDTIEPADLPLDV